MTRVLVVAPGRGSYGPRELGTLARVAGESGLAVVAAVDAARAARGLGSIRELDGRPTFSPEEHLAAENASALIFACGVADAGLFPAGVEIAGVIGNSLGFYTALAVSGALSLADAARLVVDMAALQARHGRGKQVMVPVVDESWRPSDAAASVKRALAAFPGRAFPSIHLCGFEVLAVADDACEAFLRELPKVRSGGRDYPIVLEGHHGYHSPLVAAVASAASVEIRVAFRAPRVPLVDGRGAIFTPWSTDPRELAAYTLDTQVREPFDFLASLRTAVRELGPDTIVLLGPGESIGGAIGQGLASDGLFGIHDKESFAKRQREAPVLLALGRPEQRARFLGAK